MLVQRFAGKVLDRAERDELKSALGVSDQWLRKELRAAGVPLTPLVEGVRQDSLAELERTLLALTAEYEKGGEDVRRECRRIVITAKDHARWSSKKAEGSRLEEKQEMLLWMLTWLENPAIFPDWVRIRKQIRAGQTSASARPEGISGKDAY